MPDCFPPTMQVDKKKRTDINPYLLLDFRTGLFTSPYIPTTPNVLDSMTLVNGGCWSASGLVSGVTLMCP